MFVNNKTNCNPIIGALSEKIYELIGIDAGKTNDVSVVYLELPPNALTPKHYHPNTTEIYYVLKGKSQLLIKDTLREINKHDVILIEKNSIHQLTNHSDETLHLLTISTPAWTPDSEVLAE